MRLVVVAVAVSFAALAALAGARAEALTGTSGPDRLVGTSGPDSIHALGGDDRVDGRSGGDLLDAGTGSDRVLGGDGDDRIAVSGDGFDTVACGPGRDTVAADQGDAVAADCEIVSRELSRDPYRSDGAQHQTEVEPDSFSWGSTIVTTFQAGRYASGGAANIGFATSRNAGRTWRSGFLPRLSVSSKPAGTSARVTDSSVAYDALHKTWLIVSLGGAEGVAGEDDTGENDDRLFVSRSPNGLTWSAPVVAGRGQEAFDKPWIACDNWGTSRFRGRCYLSYLDVRNGLIMTARSTNGGRSWSAAVGHASADATVLRNGAQLAVLPSGTLIVVYSAFAPFPGPDDHMTVIRSTDGGVSFSREAFAATIGQSIVFGVRTISFPSVEQDAAGKIYAVWQDCGPSEGCEANDVVLSTSTDGVSWSGPARVPTGRTDSSTDFFLPAIGVQRTTRGASARLTVAYYSLAPCQPSFCPGVEVAAVSSRNGGLTWSPPTRLAPQQMPLTWVAESDLGRMLADYISVSYAAGRPVPVFALANAGPAGRLFHQEIYAATRGIG